MRRVCTEAEEGEEYNVSLRVGEGEKKGKNGVQDECM